MKRVIVLPLDGFATAAELEDYVDKLMESKELLDLIAYIKLNDAVHNFDAGGPALVQRLVAKFLEFDIPIKIFLDLKIGDVSATLLNTLKKYFAAAPGILTVSTVCSVEGILKLRQALPDTKLAMVSVLTDITRDECQQRFGQSPEVKIYNDLMNIRDLYVQKTGTYENWPHALVQPFDLIVCSPLELPFLTKNLPDSYGYVVPGIRDAWMTKASEHQKRITGVAEALELGATFVVMGAQLTKGNPEAGISAVESCLLTQQEITAFLARSLDDFDPLAVLKACDGYYCSPLDDQGNFKGPLVAYAGTYVPEANSAADNEKKNYVGYEYFNFAQAEQDPKVRAYFAALICQALNTANFKGDVVVGAPMGGILLAGDVGRLLQRRTIFAEKKVTALADPENGQKEVSQQVIERHEIYPGDRVIVVEDVCNNYSTTEKMQKLIESRGGKLVAIVCAFNRSGANRWNEVPVISALAIPAKQFCQSDPLVSELVASGKVVWKPKLEWNKLKEAMEE